ncbi:hypothetical protein STCU_10244 [Strigomonas culicis]|uniref:Uncharacterized protein n=1 Tax=Strigomonas culicis TaxID=28005 RepID=S9TNQ8_9TRYP|nr:hypothetical protein STCU_10244 [Strigomonas culicis]|eukprot:EPY18023.1 hypothetical protein STCU_10244 [Strigomonas culicis]
MLPLCFHQRPTPLPCTNRIYTHFFFCFVCVRSRQDTTLSPPPLMLSLPWISSHGTDERKGDVASPTISHDTTGPYMMEGVSLPPVKEDLMFFEWNRRDHEAAGPTHGIPSDPCAIPLSRCTRSLRSDLIQNSDLFMPRRHTYAYTSAPADALPLRNAHAEGASVFPLPSPTHSNRFAPPLLSPLNSPSLFAPLNSPKHFLGDGDDKGDSTGAASALVKLPQVPQMTVKQINEMKAHITDDSQSCFYYTNLLLSCGNGTPAVDHGEAADTNRYTMAADGSIAGNQRSRQREPPFHTPCPQLHTVSPSHRRPLSGRHTLVGFTASTEFVPTCKVGRR